MAGTQKTIEISDVASNDVDSSAESEESSADDSQSIRSSDGTHLHRLQRVTTGKGKARAQLESEDEGVEAMDQCGRDLLGVALPIENTDLMLIISCHCGAE